jgi:tetratricopeptide (TPR) repeat protein
MVRWIVVVAAAAVIVNAASAQQADLSELQAHVRADSNDPVAHFNLGSRLAKDHHFHEAEQPLLAAVQIDPQYAPALYLLAEVRESQTIPSLMVLRGQRIYFVRADPHADENHMLKRRAFLLDPLLEIGPPSRDVLPVVWRGTLSQALRAYDAHQWPEAIAGFQTVIDKTVRPNDSTRVPPVALWFRARCALKTGEYDDAVRYLQWLLTLRMRDSSTERNWNPFAGEELRYILAYVYQQAGRWDEAIRRYQELLELDMGIDPAHSHLAEIYEAQQRWPEAVEERVRAIHTNPQAPSLFYNLGATLTAAKRYAEAIEPLEKYAANYPRDARVFYLLGVARMGAGNPGGARTALTQYLTLAPSRYVDQIDDAKRRLAMLSSQETKP